MSREKQIDIEDFITLVRDSFKDSVKTYTEGSCVKFALILKKVFPEGEVCYNYDHAVFRFQGSYYDITGEVKEEGYIPLMDLGILEINKVLKLTA